MKSHQKMSSKLFCCENNAPSFGDFKKVAHLPYSGLSIFLHAPKHEEKKQMHVSSQDSVVLYNTSNKVIKKPEYIRELCLYNTCSECKPIINWVRSLLDKIVAIKENQIFGICEHCRKAASVQCKKCSYIVSKFLDGSEKRRAERQRRSTYNLATNENITKSKDEEYALKKRQDINTAKIQETHEAKKEQEQSKVNVADGQKDKKKQEDVVLKTKSKDKEYADTEKTQNKFEVELEEGGQKEKGKTKQKEGAPVKQVEKVKNDKVKKVKGLDEKIKKLEDLKKKKRDEANNLKEDKKSQLEKQAAAKELQEAREARQAAAMRDAELLEQMAKANLMKQLKSTKQNKNVIKSVIRHDKPSTKDISIEAIIKDSCVECVVETDLFKQYVRGSYLQPYHLHCKEEQVARGPSPTLFKKEFVFNDSDNSLPSTKSMSEKYRLPTSGVIKYQLSNKEFIDKGWTKLPTMKIMRKMNIYKMQPSRPTFDWFKIHKGQKLMFYGTGEKLAEIDENCCGFLYYKNGAKALDYYSSEDTLFAHRYIVYSSGEEVEGSLIRPRTVLALFDFLGNGIVYDCNGNVRMKYNQSEGVLIDPKIGHPGRWQWHSLNDPPVMQKVFVNVFPSVRDPNIENLEPKQAKDTEKDSLYKQAQNEMLQIEMDNYVQHKAEKLVQKFKPFQIKMKAAKLNEHFSLKILEQSNIYLLYRDGSTSVKLNLGMDLISNEIIDSDISDMADIATPYDKYHPKSESIHNFKPNLTRICSQKM